VSERVLIAGARGVFGRRLVEMLLEKTSWHLVLAGRNVAGLNGMVRSIGRERASAVALDLRDPAAVADAAREVAAVCCTAGPFSALDRNVVRAVVDAGAHWLDISDDSEWVNGLLGDASLWFAAEQQGVTVAPGLSSVPAISGVCVRDILARMPKPEKTTITLFIGNKNRKGPGSIGRALVSGSSGGRTVQLPGRRATSFPFQSPDRELMQGELGLSVEFRAAFELTLGYRLFPLFKLCGAVLSRSFVAKAIALLTKPLAWFGSTEGILQVECWDEAGERAVSWVRGRGQRMPVIPCAVVLDEILADSRPPGVLRAWTEPDAGEWLTQLENYGLEFGRE
jgi:hypothetical protein